MLDHCWHVRQYWQYMADLRGWDECKYAVWHYSYKGRGYM